MWKAYPRHNVYLSRELFGILLQAIARRQVRRGPHLSRFEEEFARFIGVRHAVGVSSGRAALYLALSSLGLKEGDEVMMPAYTFHVVPQVVQACGLKPLFLDVRPDTCNLDISLIPQHLTSRTRALMVAHMFGQPCDMEAVLKIVKEKGLRLIEDCAHACGAEYRGKRVGSFGDFGFFSFGVGKNMPCFGGGMLVTDNPELWRQVQEKTGSSADPQAAPFKGIWREVWSTSLTYFATRRKIFTYLVYPVLRLLDLLGSSALDGEPGTEMVTPEEISSHYRARMSNLQAAIGLEQLTRLDEVNQRVRKNAALLRQALSGMKGIQSPTVIDGVVPTFLYYRVQVEDRQAFRRKLLRRGVDTTPDDMSACSALPLFANLQAGCPVAERLPDRMMEVPNNANLTEKDLLYIARCVREVGGNEEDDHRENPGLTDHER
ncbi:MAG: DegT/DnrJ/EryC1/StrS family aminotransferase [Candidatus Binatia bacterium]